MFGLVYGTWFLFSIHFILFFNVFLRMVSDVSFVVSSYVFLIVIVNSNPLTFNLVTLLWYMDNLTDFRLLAIKVYKNSWIFLSFTVSKDHPVNRLRMVRCFRVVSVKIYKWVKKTFRNRCVFGRVLTYVVEININGYLPVLVPRGVVYLTIRINTFWYVPYNKLLFFTR